MGKPYLDKFTAIYFMINISIVHFCTFEIFIKRDMTAVHFIYMFALQLGIFIFYYTTSLPSE